MKVKPLPEIFCLRFCGSYNFLRAMLVFWRLRLSAAADSLSLMVT